MPASLTCVSLQVSNAQFRAFVRDTKYVTEAQEYSWSFVLSYLASDKVKADPEVQKLDNAEQWLAVPGAWWRQPEGPDSSIKGREDHPVVHISLRDADTFCKWAGKRLPLEIEWERAARGGLDPLGTQQYPWGDSAVMDDGETHMMNIWQGKFPTENKKEDGYAGTAPVAAYPPNDYGLYSMIGAPTRCCAAHITAPAVARATLVLPVHAEHRPAAGNVWEWTSTLHTPPKKNAQGQDEPPKYVLRGGSYLDSADGSFNHKARVTTRMGNTPDSGSHNTGFRCAKDGADGPQRPDPPPAAQKGGKPDQAMLQKIVEEQGVEGLQQYMRESGMGGSVMTPAQLKDKQAEIRQKKDELSREL